MSQDVENRIKALAELAKSNKDIDAARLAVDILSNQEKNLLDVSQKRWAFFLSLVFPPLGFFFAIKFLLTDKEDAHQVATICAVLTTFSIVMTVLVIRGVLSGSGLSSAELQQIDPDAIRQLVE